MAFIRKNIDIISPSDGKRYTDVRKYEKSLDQKGQYVMSEREFKNMREKLRDEASSQPKKREEYNHVHIDLANDKIIKSKKDL
jgi:hypothetical protein